MKLCALFAGRAVADLIHRDGNRIIARAPCGAMPALAARRDVHGLALLLSCGLIPENELSRAAGVELNPVTNGPAVNESLETSIPGVFAAGNVLHVHDLVDYVSEEAGAAGRHAAKYIQAGCKDETARTLPVKCENGVRYTVPVAVRPDCADGLVTLRFRVGNVYKNKKVAVYAGDTCIFSRKRPVLAPGEMETVQLKAQLLLDHPEADHITVTLEEA